MNIRGTYAALAVTLLILFTAGLEPEERCETPNKQSGTCIRIRNCPPLVTLLQNKPVSQSSIQLLRRSYCGFSKEGPMICCPSNILEPIMQKSLSTDTEVTEDVSQHANLRLLRFDICGPVIDNKIINGDISELNELPWMVLVGYNVRSRNPFGCGGTIISDRYILTAAHCLDPLNGKIRPVWVRLGEHDLESEIDCQEEIGSRICAPPPQDIRIEEVIPHPRYRGKPNVQNDVALIRLSRPIDFRSDSVRPICLPIGLPQQTFNLSGKKLIVSGWGVTENGTKSALLLKVAVPVLAHEECAKVFEGVASISEASQVCAGGVKNKGDSCHGDSGGPLTYFGAVQDSARIIQHGIVSYGGKECGTANQPGVYTRVGHYMKWILDNMKE